MRRTRYKEKRPMRLGAMEPARDRTGDPPTFQKILERHGFLPKTASAIDAFSLWQRVAEDSKVIAMSQEIERPKHRMASVTAGYLYLGQALSLLSSRQLAALKHRVGVPCAVR
jgi:hypothetical protein